MQAIVIKDSSHAIFRYDGNEFTTPVTVGKFDIRLSPHKIKNKSPHATYQSLRIRLISSDNDWTHSHVSGHGSGDQIKKVIEGAEAKKLIPILTEHEEYHRKWHKNVIDAVPGNSVDL
jgi:mRNA degradation ribonuclease J1/J2